MIEGLAAYISTLNARMKKFKGAKETIREAISESLERSGREKVVTFAGTLYLQADPREVTVVNEALIDAEYIVEKIDTGALNKAVRARVAARQKIIDEMGEFADVELILALWDFDDENPEIEGVEVGELTRSMRIRRA
jgi:prefoldin subunit 5